jgi:hypothetical protein
MYEKACLMNSDTDPKTVNHFVDGDMPMPQSEDTIAVNVVVEMTTASLKAIVENAKRLSDKNDKGHYTIDTADKVGEMISRFLLKNNFEGYVTVPENYR